MTETSKENEMTTADEPQVLHMNAELPDLHIPYPQCGHCGEDVTIEDGAPYCENCLVTWDRIEDGRVSEPDIDAFEGADIPCGIVAGKQDPPWERPGRRYVPGPPKPCILPSGHEGDHLTPYDVTVTKIAEATS